MSLLSKLFKHIRQTITPNKGFAQQLPVIEQPSQSNNSTHPLTETAQLAWQEGRKLEMAGDINGALTSYQRALQLVPRHVGIRIDVAYALQLSGYHDEAYKHLLEANRLDKHNPAILSQIGFLSLELGNIDSALRRCKEAVELDPQYAPGWNNLGITARRIGNLPYAKECFKKATEVDPGYGVAWSNLGLAYRDDGELENSAYSLQKALELRPNYAPAYVNLATILMDCGRFEEASSLLSNAKRVDPYSLDVDHSLALLDLKYGKVTDAELKLKQLLERYPDNPDIRTSLAETQLLQSKFTEGWKNYESRLDSQESPRRVFPVPLWDGQSLKGKNILIYAEQGIGDMILFSSCFPDVISQGKKVIIESGPKLNTLFQNSFPTAQSIECVPSDSEYDLNNAFGNIDFYIAAGSLPNLFRRKLIDFPQHSGYLKPAHQALSIWRNKCNALGPGIKIGLNWRGGLLKTGQLYRTMALEELIPLLSMHGLHWVSLQHQDYEPEIEQLFSKHGISLSTFPEANDDFNELGALISSLDIVVTVCSSVAHLTGALGKTCLVMVPVATTWRYLAKGNSVPWYPSLRLFRQDSPGEWGNVISQIGSYIREEHMAPNS